MPVNSLRPTRSSAAGFTLAELLVTLLVVSIGMLGLVKMEAAGISESQVSRVRSLLTFQAESLAGAMRADRGYWAVTTAPPSYTYSAGTFSPDVSAAPDCTSSLCTPTQMAQYDLKSWGSAFYAAFPGATGSITATAASSNVPTSYDITLTWTEKSVAINRSGTGSTPSTSVNMVLHVQP